MLTCRSFKDWWISSWSINSISRPIPYESKDEFLRSLAEDGGLFVPKKIPSYTPNELKNLNNLSYNELAQKIILKFCIDEFSEKEITEIVNSSYKNFRAKDVVEIKK